MLVGQVRNLPLAFLKVNYPIFANKAMTADDCANTGNGEIL